MQDAVSRDPSAIESLEEQYVRRPLIDAARAGDVVAVRAALADGENLEAKAKGVTALQVASWDGRCEIVSLLVDAGAAVNPSGRDEVIEAGAGSAAVPFVAARPIA